MKDGGPAYPTSFFSDPGMSLRDWFAGKAMQGMLSADEATLDIDGEMLGIKRARTAYAIADALLAARSAAGSEQP